MKEEPSVLDYLKARLMPWKRAVPEILPVDENKIPPEAAAGSSTPMDSSNIEFGTVSSASEHPLTQTKNKIPAPTAVPWRSISALLLALFAQLFLEPGSNPDRLQSAVVFYLPAFALLVWAFFRKEWSPAPIPEHETEVDSYSFRLPALLAGILILGVAYLAFGGNRFNLLNLSLWVAGSGLILYALWIQQKRNGISEFLIRLAQWIRQPELQFRISPFTLLWLLVFAVSVFFRFYHLASVPPEMNSDHAEKLLDVADVLDGQSSIFFPRNTGREPIQFYLIAATAKIFGTGISFLSMKIGTALAGLLTLPFIYLIGKEIANRRVGLLAMAFAGIAAWPNILSRVALRFSLYPLFAAPTLYFLIRGLRSGKRNDLILSGLFLGIGLLGYTPFRILPFVVVAVVAIYLLHNRTKHHLQQAVFGLLLVTFFSIVGSLPLLRFAQENPSLFAYRAFSRLTDLDVPLSQPAWIIFLDNLKNAMLMFGWNDGQIWPVSIPGRPALDIVSAVLFHFGLLLLLIRYFTKRKWEDLTLLLAVPLLMLPSILSLAFPGENPAPNRAGGAVVPVFVIIGLSLDGLLTNLEKARLASVTKRFAVVAALLLFSFSANQNYKLVFEQYQQQYGISAWNTSEMGLVLKNFDQIGGSLAASWVVKSPHWVDTRLVGMLAGEPRRDFGIDRENIPATAADPQAKLFLIRHQVNPEDRKEEELTLSVLQESFPSGWAQLYPSQYPDKDFWIFYAPPTIPGIQNSDLIPATSP